MVSAVSRLTWLAFLLPTGAVAMATLLSFIPALALTQEQLREVRSAA